MKSLLTEAPQRPPLYKQNVTNLKRRYALVPNRSISIQKGGGHFLNNPDTCVGSKQKGSSVVGSVFERTSG